jgi:hypothetical protein
MRKRERERGKHPNRPNGNRKTNNEVLMKMPQGECLGVFQLNDEGMHHACVYV